MKNVLKVVLVIIGTLIGAGFISGQEMYTFFYSYGKYGLLGLFVCSCLISFIIYKTFKIIVEKNIIDYKQFLNILNKKSKKEHFNLAYITNVIINIFIFITFCIMISGFGTYFSQEIGINSLIGSSILAIICFIILMGNVRRIVKANEMLVPIIIIFIFFIGVYNFAILDLSDLENCFIKANNGNWLISSILYSSYNIILLVPVLITLKKYIKNKKEIKNISIISGIIIFLLSTILFLLLSQINKDIQNIEMPIAYVVSECLPKLKKIYGAVILISIFTTALSLGISFLKNIAKNQKSYTQIAIIMCITSVILSQFGFSNLINLLYPIFGVLGLVQIVNIIFYKLY